MKTFVNVCMITYNHASFIKKAIKSVLEQKCDFDFNLIIGEDSSSDETKQICQEYAELYPDKIKIIHNFSNIGMIKNFVKTLRECDGSYIAICEGDDFWTNPNKLQMQVDFLESHPEHSVCFHRYKIFDQEKNLFREDGCDFLFTDNRLQGIDIDTNLFLNHWITQPVTMVYRRNCFDISLAEKYSLFRDIHLIYHLLQSGKCFLFSFEGAVYREHLGGLHSKKPLKHQVDIGISVAKELYLKNKYNRILKENFLRTLNWGITTYGINKYNINKVLSFIFNHLYYSKSIKKFIKNVSLVLLPNQLIFKKSNQKLEKKEPIIINTEELKSSPICFDPPLVSVFMVTYNHGKYIKQAIESIIMQKTSFNFEIVIGEDCSTDSTKSIIQDYVNENPGLIRPLFQSNNVGRKQNTYGITLPVCQGKYIAYLEGDDYWTDPDKLQKQVDFLENHPEYSVTFHRCKIYDQENNQFREDGCDFLFKDNPNEGVDVNTSLFLNHWITQSLTMVYRRELFDFSLVPKYKHFRDMHHIYHLLQKGKGYLFSFKGGVYREHLEGLHSKKPLKYQIEIGIAVAKELYDQNRRDKQLKDNYLRTLQWGISCFSSNNYDHMQNLSYIIDHLLTSGMIKRSGKNILSMLKRSNIYGQAMPGIMLSISF